MHHKWNTKNEVDDAICTLKHRDIIGFTQTGGFGLGSTNYSPFFVRTEGTNEMLP